ncbi:MAG: class I SAM-dependent DNA methyltransferase [Caldicoprobacterales bacterium]|nr:class I SAM-dependent methyltransferase [Clostridiales bacterium]
MFQDFAYLYDRLMSNVNYNKWANHIEAIFHKHGKKPKTMLDLACGTGGVTSIMASRGYQVIGVDISEDMLFVAKEKARKLGLHIPYICQDMSELTLHRPVDAILCMNEGFNYILNEKKLKQTFLRLRHYLNPDGIIVFDIASQFKLSSVLGNNTMAVNDEDVSMIWFNNFDEEKQILELRLTFFERLEDEENSLYQRYDETHFQRAWTIEELTALLIESGFSHVNTYGADSLETPSRRSHRIYFSAM